MFKIFTFLKRNPALGRDDFRAGLIGYHAGHSRRMKGVRGYLVNIQSDAALPVSMTAAMPPGFLDEWDGFPAMWFDGPEGWRGAREGEPTRAMKGGLAVDPDRMPQDGPHLFDPQPGRTDAYRSRPVALEEIPVLPVERPERRLVKLVQFFRRNPAVGERDFRAGVIRHAALAAALPGLHGYTLNFRDPDDDAALRGVYPPDDWRFSEEGRAWRNALAHAWDGAAELWCDDVAAVVAGQAAPEMAGLPALERHLFDAAWWVALDESVVVMPNRDPAPDFYYR
jgi:hypothetical protein